jgi:hypothetical protein
VLGNGDVQLGFAVMPDGSFTTYCNGYSARSHQTQVWEKEVKRRLRDLQMEAVMRLLGQTVKSVRRDGETVFVATPKKEKA